MSAALEVHEAVAVLEQIDETRVDPTIRWRYAAAKGLALARVARYDEAFMSFDEAMRLAPDDRERTRLENELFEVRTTAAVLRVR